MKLDIQRRIAAKILKVGETRVWIDPDSAEEISKAITKEDIKGLIAQGLIKVKPKKGVSKGRVRILKKERKEEGRDMEAEKAGRKQEQTRSVHG